MLATLREPPPRGSLQDFVLQALVIKLDQIEYAKTRAVIQATINPEKAQEALDSYRDVQFPYFERVQKDQRQVHIKRLMSEVQRGALSITPITQKKVQSKLRTRVVERSSDEYVEQVRRISKKIGGYR